MNLDNLFGIVRKEDEISSCWLQKYGPRKSVDVVVSFSCVSCLVCVIFTCFMVVRAEENFTSSIYVWEAMCWLLAVGMFLLKFMMLGSKTNQKFHNSSILTTEQVRLILITRLPYQWENFSFSKLQWLDALNFPVEFVSANGTETSQEGTADVGQ